MLRVKGQRKRSRHAQFRERMKESQMNGDTTFEAFEANSGALGHVDGLCNGEAPPTIARADAAFSLPCTRIRGHAGDHVAAHTDGRVLARWSADDER
jgi:hypothetical protein